MERIVIRFCLILLFLNSLFAFSQAGSDSVLAEASLENCVQYALKHQPLINQSLIDEQITDREIKSHLADWYPQLNLSASYQDNFQLQATKFGNQVVNVGTYNVSGANFALTQTIFNRDVLLARNTAKDVRTQAKQNSTNYRIRVAAAVSKAFYDALLSSQQIALFAEDIILLERSYKDAYNQYKGGLVDKTDYQRASISLNNARSQKKTAEEQLKSKLAYLKQLMSYPVTEELKITYDSTRMANDALQTDTSQLVDIRNRIEFQQLETARKLENANLRYNKWAFLPSLSAFGEYNLNYFSSQFKNLYADNFPNSYAGLSLNFPIFQGTKRIQQIRIAKLQLDRLEYDFIATKDSINAQFTEAIAAYKANLNNYLIQKDNLSLAREVYNVIQLQYRSGIKTYLDVVTANNDLFAAQINYTNALFQVLSNRVDVQVALGTLAY
jgi:outer membrane protein TolC